MASRLPLTLTRRTLLAALSGALGMAAPGTRTREPAPVSAPKKQGWYPALQETYVASTAYYEVRRVDSDLRPGDALILCWSHG